jgi:hypothetical protein
VERQVLDSDHLSASGNYLVDAKLGEEKVEDWLVKVEVYFIIRTL